VAGAGDGRLARQPRRAAQPADGHARLDRAVRQGRRLAAAPPGLERPGRGRRPRPLLGAAAGPHGPELLVRLYEHHPDRRREAHSLVGRDQARAVKGAITRFANFFAAVQGGFDAAEAGWSFEDVDFAYFRAPYLAQRDDADSCVRLLLEDFAHYATLRKPRRGEDATLVFDEFSAIAGGREAAIQLTERVRDAGCALYLSAQSADGLGDEAQQRRLVGACSGGLLLHAMPDPHSLLSAAGVVKVVEQTWRLDPAGPTGNSSARIGERPRIEPGAVQQAREGEAWLITRGRYEHLMVARTHVPDAYRTRAHAIVALARSLRPAAAIPGARSWAEVQATASASGALALVGVGGHLALPPAPDPPPAPVGPQDAPEDGPDGDGAAPLVAGYRLRLAVIAAARDGDAAAATALIRHAQAQGLDPSWLLAVAARHWPPPRLHTRAWRAVRRWAASGARWAWARRPRRPRSRATRVLVGREAKP
jgi:hypothetical protein